MSKVMNKTSFECCSFSLVLIPVNVSFRFLTAAVILVMTSYCLTAQTLNFEKTVAVTHGTIWCIPVDDGRGIVVSAESDDGIRLAKYDLTMTPTGTSVLVASTNDTVNQDTIADHKHIFQNDHHYLAFSIAGDGAGGYLYLLKLNKDLGRVALTTVVSNDPPTNDMLMVGDGTNVYVGKFLPGTGHRIYSYDADLNLLGSKTIGGDKNRHANGAAAIYADNVFYVVAPDTLAPGQNNIFSRITFDHNWNCVSNKTTILSDPGVLSIVSGLARDPVSRSFIVNYARSASDQGGPIYAAIYDSSWNSITNQSIVTGTLNRPHSVIVSNTFYLGYDGSDFAVSVFSISNTVDTPAVGPLIKANGSTNNISINSGANLSITVQLNPGEYADINVDWWIIVLANSSWYCLDSSMQWAPFDGNLANCRPVYQGGLFNLPSAEVLNITGLPIGSYTFWFAVDYPMDGILNVNGSILVDSVNVTVQ